MLGGDELAAHFRGLDGDEKSSTSGSWFSSPTALRHAETVYKSLVTKWTSGKGGNLRLDGFRDRGQLRRWFKGMEEQVVEALTTGKGGGAYFANPRSGQGQDPDRQSRWLEFFRENAFNRAPTHARTRSAV